MVAVARCSVEVVVVVETSHALEDLKYSSHPPTNNYSTLQRSSPLVLVGDRDDGISHTPTPSHHGHNRAKLISESHTVNVTPIPNACQPPAESAQNQRLSLRPFGDF